MLARLHKQIDSEFKIKCASSHQIASLNDVVEKIYIKFEMRSIYSKLFNCDNPSVSCVLHRNIFEVDTGSSFRNNARSLRHFSTTKNHQKCPYTLLHVSRDATPGQVKSAYYKLSMIYHPDKNDGNESALQKFRDITDAYEILGDAVKRRQYDQRKKRGDTME